MTIVGVASATLYPFGITPLPTWFLAGSSLPFMVLGLLLHVMTMAEPIAMAGLIRSFYTASRELHAAEGGV